MLLLFAVPLLCYCLLAIIVYLFLCVRLLCPVMLVWFVCFVVFVLITILLLLFFLVFSCVVYLFFLVAYYICLLKCWHSPHKTEGLKLTISGFEPRRTLPRNQKRQLCQRYCYHSNHSKNILRNRHQGPALKTLIIDLHPIVSTVVIVRYPT